MNETVRGRDWLLSPEKQARDKRMAGELLRASGLFLHSLGAISLREFKLDPIYREKRVGLEDEEFWCYKSRTTPMGAAYEDHARLPPMLQAIRLVGLDEVLQAVNVMNGDMVMVGGPRPLARHGDGTSHQSIEMMEDVLPANLFDPWYAAYTSVRPSLLSSYGNRGKLLPPGDLQRQCIVRAECDIDDIENASPDRDEAIMRESMEYLSRIGGMAIRSMN